MTLPRIFGAAMLAASLGACTYQGNPQGDDAATDTMPTTLNAYHWTLNRAVTASGAPDPSWIHPTGNVPIRLTFDAQRVSVAGLCNIMSADYQTDGPNIRIGQMVSTMKTCPDASLMRYEQAVGQRLPQAATWHITRMHDEPVGQPSLTLRFTDGAQWVLTATPTSETQYGSTGETLFLEVAAHTVPCSDPLIPQRQCLYVRTIEYDATGLKQRHGSWEPFYGHIDNYQHQPGIRQVLRVTRYTRANPPTDASRYAYVMDRVVESEIMTTPPGTPS